MKPGVPGVLLVVLLGAAAPPQSPGSLDVARDFRVRRDGLLEVGGVTAEIYHYDAAWVISQQHDRFEPSAASWAPARGSGARGRTRVITGVMRTARGPATLQERVQPLDGGVRFQARLSSERPLPTNELSVAFLLPTARYADAQLRVNGRPLRLPRAAPPPQRARILWSQNVGSIALPVRGGTLLVTGRFHLLVQDDREWGDSRYSVRLYFTPGSGSIRESAIDLRMRVDRSGEGAKAKA